MQSIDDWCGRKCVLYFTDGIIAEEERVLEMDDVGPYCEQEIMEMLCIELFAVHRAE